MSQAFKAGDQVQMITGGPAMAVSGVDEIGRIICKWFDGNNQQHSGTFEAEILKPYEAPKRRAISAGMPSTANTRYNPFKRGR